jgi:hypothetical protein
MKKFKKTLKGPGKELMPRLVQAGIVGGSAVATAAISAKLMPNPAQNKKGINPNLHGPLFLAVGTAADVFFQDDNIRAAGKGMAAYGALRTVAQMSKEKATANFGMQYFAPTKKSGTSGISQSYEEIMAEQAATNGAAPDFDDDDLNDDDDDV